MLAHSTCNSISASATCSVTASADIVASRCGCHDGWALTCLYQALLDTMCSRRGATWSQQTFSVWAPQYTCSCLRYQCQLLRCQICTRADAACSCCASVVSTTASSSELLLQLSCVRRPAGSKVWVIETQLLNLCLHLLACVTFAAVTHAVTDPHQ